MRVEAVVDPGGDDFHLRVSSVHRPETFGARDEVEENDALLRDAVVDQDFDGLDGGTAGG